MYKKKHMKSLLGGKARKPWVASLSLLLAGGAVAESCGSGGKLSQKPSKSSTIAMTEDEKYVAMANPDDDSVSIFKTADNSRVAKVAVGDEPWAVVFAADDTLYVANRGAATVSKITNATKADAKVSATAEVGSEPTGLALSPAGTLLYVAEFAEGRVSAIDTASMTEKAAAKVRNPRALAVTNDKDGAEDDETVIVTEFYGRPTSSEGKNDSRTGHVVLLNASTLKEAGGVDFIPSDTGFKKDISANAADSVRGTGEATVASHNQLGSVAIVGSRIFVTSVSAAPAVPVRFNNNVYPFVLVGDLASKTEKIGAGGTTNLLLGITEDASRAAITPAGKRLAMGDIQDIAFVGDKNIGYVVSRAADGVQRAVFDDAAVTLGSSQNFQIDVVGDAPVGAGCKGPNGIVVNSKGTKGYVNCWVSRRLGVLDLGGQVLETAVESSAFPAAGTDDEHAQKGKRFYFTGRGRWSKGGEGWSSCGSCHPDALSDNITWIFGTGPRQTTSQDGSFSHGKAGAGKQRVFNWTGVFDEHHDFERNTRGTSGGPRGADQA